MPPALSLSLREEIEKQKSKERYMKLHLEGKTDQAKADLARLAIIKKQREEAAKKRDDLRKGENTQQLTHGHSSVKMLYTRGGNCVLL